MSQIGWDEATPSDGESASLGDDRIRSLKTSLRQGLAAEHTWPSGGGDSGIHLLGSARAYYGAQSAVSSSGTDGRIMVTSDTTRLFHVGSGGTALLGGARVISAGSWPGGVPQRAHWVEEFGADFTGSAGSVLVTIPNSGYSGQPYIFLQSAATDVTTITDVKFVASKNGAASFVAHSIGAGAVLLANQPFHWRSIGTRAL